MNENTDDAQSSCEEKSEEPWANTAALVCTYSIRITNLSMKRALNTRAKDPFKARYPQSEADGTLKVSFSAGM